VSTKSMTKSAPTGDDVLDSEAMADIGVRWVSVTQPAKNVKSFEAAYEYVVGRSSYEGRREGFRSIQNAWVWINEELSEIINGNTLTHQKISAKASEEALAALDGRKPPVVRIDDHKRKRRKNKKK